MSPDCLLGVVPQPTDSRLSETSRLYGVGPRVKQVDVAREIKVKNICGSNVDLRPGLSIDLSTFLPAHQESQFKFLDFFI